MTNYGHTKEFLDEKVFEYNKPEFIKNGPIQILP